MNLELFTNQLVEIAEKIHQLELQEAKEDNTKKHPDVSIYLQRKATWKTLKSNIERKLELINKEVTDNSKEKKYFIILLNKLSNYLTRVEEKINNLEANLEQSKIVARRKKGFEIIILVSFIVALSLIIIYEFIIERSPNNFLN
jgi:tetrahydromethanopterin S-methyltransferase subunit G